MCDVDLGIWREILLRLPAESLIRFIAVCKRWRTIINDPGFVKAHTKNYQLPSNACNIILRNSTGPPFSPLYYFNLGDLNYETDEPQTIPVVPLNLTRGGLSSLRSLPVAACNGLLLTAPRFDESDGWDWEIRNPLTQERLKLPKLNIVAADSKVVGYGLGYDSAADDYKVVVIDCFLLNSKTQTHVYSLKSNSWKKIGNCPFDLLNTKQRRGVFLNGALHWLSSDDNGITVLDVGAESYRQLSLPDIERGPTTSTTQLEVLSGCLFFTHRYIKNVVYSPYRSWDEKHIDAWLMSYDGRKEDSWLKFFSSHSFNKGDLRPVAYLKNKRRVFLQDDHQIFWLDFERSEDLKRVNIHALCNLKRVNLLHAENSIISAQAFVGTLFRLSDCCGGRVAATKQKKNTGFSRLTFCVNGYGCPPYPKRHCYRLNSNWHHQSCNGGKEKICASFIPFDTLSYVPLDICREIFFRLPAKSLIRFRDVCSAWRAILDDPDFEEAYTNKQSDTNIIIRSSTGPPFYPLYSLNLDDLDFTDGLQRIAATPLDDTPRGFPCPPEEVASCNGLMLIPYENTYEIWNPLTQERLKLPQPNIKKYNKVGTGLGYDYASDDYKAVVLHRLFESRNYYTTQTHVYSLRTDSWRNLGDCPCDPEGLAVFFAGALHWIVQKSKWNVAKTILSLDLRTESYWEMELPHPFYQKRPYLSVLGDCLAYSYHSDPHFVVWVMDDNEDEDYPWTQLFSIDSNYYKIGTKLRPVVYMKDKTQVFLQDDDFGFYVFDLERKSMKKVCIHGQLKSYCAQFIPGTICRLRDKCGATGKRRRITIMRSKKKMKLFCTELYFCVRDAKSWGFSHDDCHRKDPDWDHLSSEDEEEDYYSTFKG